MGDMSNLPACMCVCAVPSYIVWPCLLSGSTILVAHGIVIVSSLYRSHSSRGPLQCYTMYESRRVCGWVGVYVHMCGCVVALMNDYFGSLTDCLEASLCAFVFTCHCCYVTLLCCTLSLCALTSKSHSLLKRSVRACACVRACVCVRAL